MERHGAEAAAAGLADGEASRDWIAAEQSNLNSCAVTGASATERADRWDSHRGQSGNIGLNIARGGEISDGLDDARRVDATALRRMPLRDAGVADGLVALGPDELATAVGCGTGFTETTVRGALEWLSIDVPGGDVAEVFEHCDILFALGASPRQEGLGGDGNSGQRKRISERAAGHVSEDAVVARTAWLR